MYIFFIICVAIAGVVGYYLGRMSAIDDIPNSVRNTMSDCAWKMMGMARRGINKITSETIAEDPLRLCVNHPDYNMMKKFKADMVDLELEIQDAIRQIEAGGLRTIMGELDEKLK